MLGGSLIVKRPLVERYVRVRKSQRRLSSGWRDANWTADQICLRLSSTNDTRLVLHNRSSILTRFQLPLLEDVKK